MIPHRDDYRRGKLPCQKEVALAAKQLLNIVQANPMISREDLFFRFEGKYFTRAIDLLFAHSLIEEKQRKIDNKIKKFYLTK